MTMTDSEIWAVRTLEALIRDYVEIGDSATAEIRRVIGGTATKALDQLRAARSADPALRVPEREQQQIEALAAYAHDAWSGWMRHLFSKCANARNEGWWIPQEWAARWQRQIDTPYAELREDEKESDRKEARRMLAALRVGAPPAIENLALQAIRERLRDAAVNACGVWFSRGDCEQIEAALRVSAAPPHICGCGDHTTNASGRCDTCELTDRLKVEDAAASPHMENK